MKKIFTDVILLLLNAMLILFLIGFLLNKDFVDRQTKDQIIIGAFYPSMDNAYYEQLNNKINSITEGYGDVLLSRDALMSQEKQNSQIENMVDQGVKGIFVVPVDWIRISPALVKAKEKGIYVVVMDTPVYQSELVDSTVTYDNYDAGQQVAHYLLEQASSCDIVLLEQPNKKSVVDRLDGFVAGISGHTGFRVVMRAAGDEQTESIVNVMEQVIRQGTVFDTVFVANDISALSAMAVLKKYGKTDVKIVGMSGSPEVKSLIKNDEMVVVAALLPIEMGNRATQAMYALLNGTDYDKDVLVPIQLITKQTVNCFDMDKWQ